MQVHWGTLTRLVSKRCDTITVSSDVTVTYSKPASLSETVRGILTRVTPHHDCGAGAGNFLESLQVFSQPLRH